MVELSVDEISGIVIGIAGIPFLIALIIMLLPLFSDMLYGLKWFLCDYVIGPIHYTIHDFVCSCVESHHRRELHKKGGFRD